MTEVAFLVFSLPSQSPRYEQYQLLVFTNISETLVSPVTPTGSIMDDRGLCGSWAVWRQANWKCYAFTAPANKDLWLSLKREQKNRGWTVKNQRR